MSYQPVQRLRGHTASLADLAWLPDAARLLSGSADSTVRLWKPDTTDALECFDVHTDGILSLKRSSDGQIFASKSLDGTVRLWLTEYRKTIAIFIEPAPEPQISGLAFHPSAFRLATCSDDGRSVRLWELDEERLLYTL